MSTQGQRKTTWESVCSTQAELITGVDGYMELACGEEDSALLGLSLFIQHEWPRENKMLITIERIENSVQ